jgi:hypothetical protein
VARTVAACGVNDDAASIAAALLALKPDLGLTAEEIGQALDPQRFVRVRAIVGGPAPEVASAALAELRGRCGAFERWIDAKRKLLEESRVRLRAS